MPEEIEINGVKLKVGAKALMGNDKDMRAIRIGITYYQLGPSRPIDLKAIAAEKVKTHSETLAEALADYDLVPLIATAWTKCPLALSMARKRPFVRIQDCLIGQVYDKTLGPKWWAWVMLVLDLGIWVIEGPGKTEGQLSTLNELLSIEYQKPSTLERKDRLVWKKYKGEMNERNGRSQKKEGQGSA